MDFLNFPTCQNYFFQSAYLKQREMEGEVTLDDSQPKKGLFFLATLLPLITSFFYPLPISSLCRVFTLVGWWIRGERNTWNRANWQNVRVHPNAHRVQNVTLYLWHLRHTKKRISSYSFNEAKLVSLSMTSSATKTRRIHMEGFFYVVKSKVFDNATSETSRNGSAYPSIRSPSLSPTSHPWNWNGCRAEAW